MDKNKSCGWNGFVVWIEKHKAIVENALHLDEQLSGYVGLSIFVNKVRGLCVVQFLNWMSLY